LLQAASEGDIPELAVEVADTDLVQLLYTSGTTSKPKGAMMTHCALIHEYLSCLQALDLREDDDAHLSANCARPSAHCGADQA
jgi:fatty-acyl-CoA synthase